MAIKDITKKPYIQDRDENVFIGISLPFRKSFGVEGWFASESTTIEAVKNDIKNLLLTRKGERILQPNLGLNLQRFMFEQYTDETRIAIENEITDSVTKWLPFIEIKELKITSKRREDIGKNAVDISVVFNIKQNPHSLESISVQIT